jgi:hypothetical protein
MLECGDFEQYLSSYDGDVLTDGNRGYLLTVLINDHTTSMIPPSMTPPPPEAWASGAGGLLGPRSPPEGPPGALRRRRRPCAFPCISCPRLWVSGGLPGPPGGTRGPPGGLQRLPGPLWALRRRYRAHRGPERPRWALQRHPGGPIGAGREGPWGRWKEKDPGSPEGPPMAPRSLGAHGRFPPISLKF